MESGRAQQLRYMRTEVNMRIGRIQIYYNGKKGYIITALTKVKEVGINTVINPAVFLPPYISDDELGKNLRDNLARSKDAMPIEREESKKYKFWQSTGIKSWTAFSKKYECVAIYEEGNKLMLMRLKQSPTGAYSFPKAQDATEVEMDVLDKELGLKVMEMFRLPEQGEKAIINEFETVNGGTVKYRMDIDGFADADDGHTDAYQMFRHENDENTFIAFVIDSGYQDVNEDAVKSSWEKLYGSIEEYELKRMHNSHIQILASAKTKNAYIRSYFYRDAEDWLELFVCISMDSKLLKGDFWERKIDTLAESVEIGGSIGLFRLGMFD